MNFERRRIVALIAFCVIALGIVVWQTTATLRDSRQTKAYDLTPPTAFAAGSEPTIIDPAKLAGPLVPDEAFSALMAAGRADFALVGGLRISNRAGLVERMGSEAKADRVIGTLAPDAANLAGSQVELISVAISDYSERGAVVTAFASYQLAGQPPAYRTFGFAYAPADGGYRLNDVTESSGDAPAVEAGE